LLKDKSHHNLREAQDLACQLENNLKLCELDDLSVVDSLQDEVINLSLTHDIFINEINTTEKEESPTIHIDDIDEWDLPSENPIIKKWYTGFSDMRDVEIHSQDFMSEYFWDQHFEEEVDVPTPQQND
jgi:hypothetical protein